MVEVDVVILWAESRKAKMVKLGMEEERIGEKKAWRRRGERSWELEQGMRERVSSSSRSKRSI